MRLQDLQDDLENYALGLVHQVAEDYPAMALLARRVADLFEGCSHCGGSGSVLSVNAPPDDLPARCPTCGGTGIEASDNLADLWALSGLYYFQEAGMALARYLFGEER